MIKNQKLTEEDKATIIRLRKDGHSLNEIVREIGNKVSPQRVDAIFKAYELNNFKKI